MYLILTQCFPSRLGGIESLMSNLAINIGKKNKVLVFADQHHIKNDTNPQTYLFFLSYPENVKTKF